MTRRIIDYLKADLRQSIVNDIRDIAHYHARPRKKVEAGFFSVPRHVFCYVDFLGHIAIGRDNTESAVSFIRDYFPSQYRDYAALIYSMWRFMSTSRRCFTLSSRISHQRKFKLRGYRTMITSNIERSLHLHFLPMAGKRGKIHLCINICQLVDDLLTALDNFVNRLTSNSNLKRDCQRRLNNVFDPKPHTSIHGKHWQHTVYQEIGLAWKNRSNTKIDNLGNTIKAK